ncbi:MAG: endonuclease domain-containing protein [Planctomycetota bacterium]
MTEFYNRTREKARRRHLRRNLTPAEKRLWFRLRDHQLGGLKFRRQYSVGPYVIDFYCVEKKLAVEVDGDSHFGGGSEERDELRDRFLRDFGIRVLRFTNVDVYKRVESVLEHIFDVADGVRDE